jgi:hypothetical protein
MEYRGEKLHEKNKYLSPPGEGNKLYFVPGTSAEWLSDPTMPVVITEGEKKTLGLWNCSWDGLGDSADSPRFLPVGLPGVWNWRGTVAKIGGPDGDRRDVKGVVPDFDRIQWKSRNVSIVFDVNAGTNQSVAAARDELAKELTRRGAIVSLLDLPAVEGINGVDDLIGRWGPRRVLDLFGQARPWKQVAASRREPSVDEIARAITLEYRFARDPGGRLYLFRDGVYRPLGERFVQQ